MATSWASSFPADSGLATLQQCAQIPITHTPTQTHVCKPHPPHLLVLFFLETPKAVAEEEL